MLLILVLYKDTTVDTKEMWWRNGETFLANMTCTLIHIMNKK